MVVAGRNAVEVEGMATVVSLEEDEHDWPNNERGTFIVRSTTTRPSWQKGDGTATTIWVARSKESGLAGNAASREAHFSLAFAARDSFKCVQQI